MHRSNNKKTYTYAILCNDDAFFCRLKAGEGFIIPVMLYLWYFVEEFKLNNVIIFKNIYMKKKLLLTLAYHLYYCRYFGVLIIVRSIGRYFRKEKANVRLFFSNINSHYYHYYIFTFFTWLHIWYRQGSTYLYLSFIFFFITIDV